MPYSCYYRGAWKWPHIIMFADMHGRTGRHSLLSFAAAAVRLPLRQLTKTNSPRFRSLINCPAYTQHIFRKHYHY